MYILGKLNFKLRCYEIISNRVVSLSKIKTVVWMATVFIIL